MPPMVCVGRGSRVSSPPLLLTAALSLAIADALFAEHLRALSSGVGKKLYSENFLCLPKFCTNPIFPAISMFGTSVLAANENRTWECAGQHDAWQQAGFCSKIVSGYHFSVPQAKSGKKADYQLATAEVSSDVLLQIKEQERLAITAYVAHLAAMGHDVWDNQEPWKEDACIQSVWKMACYTHFPRCNKLQEGQYLRPCRNSCEVFVNSCGVECCDEGVQCVFNHQKQLVGGGVITEEGYVDQSGPSPLCTGASTLTTGRPQVVLTLLVLCFGLFEHQI